jgi:sigma-B regulation protein RsbU (phosphoserine phosphatase)
VKAINESVAEFARGAEQSDDITMLAMQYCGKCEK